MEQKIINKNKKKYAESLHWGFQRKAKWRQQELELISAHYDEKIENYISPTERIIKLVFNYSEKISYEIDLYCFWKNNKLTIQYQQPKRIY